MLERLSKPVRWILVLIILIALVAVGIFATRQWQKSQVYLQSPLEISQEFEVVETAPRFKILAAHPESESLDLQIVWPVERSDEKITSKISCGSDIKINNIPKNSTQKTTEPVGTVETMSLSRLMQEIQNTPPVQLIFSGKCGDNACEKITSECILYVNSI